MEIDAHFKPSVSHLDLAELDRSPDVIYFIDRGFTLCGFNPAWMHFAQQNGGEDVLKKYAPGRSILDAIPPIILDFYQSNYHRAIQESVRFDHDFRCSSPDVYRVFRQTAYPLPNRAGLMIVNSLVENHPHSEGAMPLSEKYFKEDGKIVAMCAHCRKVQDQTVKHKWDWAPAVFEYNKLLISHGLCPHCSKFYYP